MEPDYESLVLDAAMARRNMKTFAAAGVMGVLGKVSVPLAMEMIDRASANPAAAVAELGGEMRDDNFLYPGEFRDGLMRQYTDALMTESWKAGAEEDAARQANERDRYVGAVCKMSGHGRDWAEFASPFEFGEAEARMYFGD